ncbi:lysosomal thioesterase PPT2-A-like [Babylonia areolata]|uniref:lysosomal thioesterase PPT2-A-like n=1 Tax=Babylonia areolata TaxID=304850 RepID=UPI003FD60227
MTTSSTASVVTRVVMAVALVMVLGPVGWWGRGCVAQRSIVWVHGILADAAEFKTMQAWIQKDYPNVTTHSLTCYPNLLSIEPLWTQLGCFAQQLTVIMDTSPDGVKLICYSQGGVICRGLLSTLRHNVDTFIALSSPLAGQFGDTNYLKPFLHDIVKEEAYLLFYTKIGQDISVGNYWNDPHHREMYLKENIYLTQLNNETYNPKSEEFKSNFLRVTHVILVGGPQDEIIGPWQSSHFGFYDSNEVVQPVTQQSWYINDAFGLKTLQREGRIHTYVVPGVRHTHWPTTLSVYQQCVKPWLA